MGPSGTMLIKLGDFAIPKSGLKKGVLNSIKALIRPDLARAANFIGIQDAMETSAREQVRIVVSKALEAIKPEFRNTASVDPEKETEAINVNLGIIRDKFQKVIPNLEVSNIKFQINKYKQRQDKNYLDIARDYLEGQLKGHLWVMVYPGKLAIEFKTSEEIAELIKYQRNTCGFNFPTVTSSIALFGAAFISSVLKHNTIALGALSIALLTSPFVIMSALRYRDLNSFLRFFQEQEGLVTMDVKQLKSLELLLETAVNNIESAKDFDIIEPIAIETASQIADAKIDKYNKRKLYVALLKAITISSKRPELKGAFFPLLYGDLEDKMTRTFPSRDDRVAIFVDAGAVAKKPANNG